MYNYMLNVFCSAFYKHIGYTHPVLEGHNPVRLLSYQAEKKFSAKKVRFRMKVLSTR